MSLGGRIFVWFWLYLLRSDSRSSNNFLILPDSGWAVTLKTKFPSRQTCPFCCCVPRTPNKWRWSLGDTVSSRNVFGRSASPKNDIQRGFHFWKPSWLSTGYILTETMVLKCFKDALFWISDQSRKRTQKNSSLFLNACINVQDSNMGTPKFVVYMVLNHPFWEHCNLNNFEHISAITGLLTTFHSFWMVCSPNMTQGDPLRTLPSWKLETSPISEAAPNDSGTGSVDV